MERGRIRHALQYRRARTLLYVIGLFWLWVWLGSAALLEGLYHSPLHAALAMYAIAVAVLVSLPAALLAVVRMILAHPGRNGVVALPQRAAPPADAAHWWEDRHRLLIGPITASIARVSPALSASPVFPDAPDHPGARTERSA